VMLSVAGLITALMLPCTATSQPMAATNRGVVEIETSGTGGISVEPHRRALLEAQGLGASRRAISSART